MRNANNVEEVETWRLWAGVAVGLRSPLGCDQKAEAAQNSIKDLVVLTFRMSTKYPPSAAVLDVIMRKSGWTESKY